VLVLVDPRKATARDAVIRLNNLGITAQMPAEGS